MKKEVIKVILMWMVIYTVIIAITTAQTERIFIDREYEVRFGYAYNYGSRVIMDDGYECRLNDPPEFKEGQRVRVLFCTMGTSSVKDDKVIDIIGWDS